MLEWAAFAKQDWWPRKTRSLAQAMLIIAGQLFRHEGGEHLVVKSANFFHKLFGILVYYYYLCNRVKEQRLWKLNHFTNN